MMTTEELETLAEVCEYLIPTEPTNSPMFLKAGILNNYLVGLISTGAYPK